MLKQLKGTLRLNISFGSGVRSGVKFNNVAIYR